MKPTEQQHRAIWSDAKKILCVAGSGSGKTATLVKRIVRLIESGVDAADICVIVYTNEAARVVYDRLHPESGEFAINLGFLGTLHSFCLRYLQEFGGMANVTVLDADEADAELLRCAKMAGVKATPKELTERRKFWNVRQYDTRRDVVHIAVASYYRKMEANRALDFNAILTKAFEGLNCEKCNGTKFVRITVEPSEVPGQKGRITCPYCAGKEQCAWKHLLVDEFQDAARIDLDIYDVIDAESRFFVGDPDQAIFGWRGGDISGIMKLAADDDWEKILLEGNFRSGPEICAAAQRLIEHDQERVRKVLKSLTDAGSTVGSETFTSDVAEAVGIAEAIAVQTESGTSPKDFAVLARTNAIVDHIAATLEAHRVPVLRRTKPELPADWKRARAAVRMLQARNDDSIIRFIRLADPENAAEIERAAALDKLNLREEFMSGLECTIGSVGRDLTRLRISRWSIERIEALTLDIPEPTMADLVLAAVQDYEHESVGDGVTVTTIHGAKGREWATVILAGFEEETIPGVRYLNLAEERRIAYVGMTRAKRRLVFTWVEARRENWGRRDYRETTRSRFVGEAGL